MSLLQTGRGLLNRLMPADAQPQIQSRETLNAVWARSRHLTVTWAIPDNYGGMTNALFHRSRALNSAVGIQTDIVTFDWRPSYASVRSDLTAKGVIGNGLRLLNVWDWLEQLNDKAIADLPLRTTSTTLAPQAETLVEAPGTRRRIRHMSEDQKTVIQQDYYRSDGTLLIAERAISDPEGQYSSRTLVLCDRSGKPVKTFSKLRDLYYLWLDVLSQGEPTFAIIDSKYVANFMHEYRRNNVATIYMVHGSHLSSAINSPYSPLSQPRREAFMRLENFDGVVLLTDRQYTDTAQRLADIGNLFVIPNSREFDGADTGKKTRRDESRAIMVASLDKRKQVDHAIRAISEVNSNNKKPLNLHIFGDGPEAGSIRNTIHTLDVEQDVHLEGFTNDVGLQFQKASFSLLTSRAEGLPLVILESMSRGCIPICYDMKYGPAQIIEHGVSGYLVPPDDEKALARTINNFTALSPTEKAEMRRAAISRCYQFSDQAIVPLWLDMFSSVMEHKTAKRGWSGNITAAHGSMQFSGGQLDLKCDVRFDSAPAVAGIPRFPIMLTLRERRGRNLYRANITAVERLSDENYRVSAKFPAHALSYPDSAIYDAYAEIFSNGALISARVGEGTVSGRFNFYTTQHGNLSIQIP